MYNSYITIRTSIRDLFLPETQMYLNFILTIEQQLVYNQLTYVDINRFDRYPVFSFIIHTLHIVGQLPLLGASCVAWLLLNE